MAIIGGPGRGLRSPDDGLTPSVVEGRDEESPHDERTIHHHARALGGCPLEGLISGLDVAKTVLDDRRVIDDVAAYYDCDSNDAGGTLLDVDPFDPYAVTSGDLLALTLLSVHAELQAVRRLLELTATHREIRHLLTEGVLPLDADLTMADEQTLLAMENLHEAITRSLSPSTSQHEHRWVAASMLCARKRPDLFPVRNAVVCDLLELSGPRHNDEMDWQVYRHVIPDHGVRVRLDSIADEVTTREAVNSGHPNRRLITHRKPS